MKSTPTSRAAAASSRSRSVGANICNRSQARWTPGRPCVRPPDSTTVSTPPEPTAVARNEIPPSPMTMRSPTSTSSTSVG